MVSCELHYYHRKSTKRLAQESSSNNWIPEWWRRSTTSRLRAFNRETAVDLRPRKLLAVDVYLRPQNFDMVLLKCKANYVFLTCFIMSKNEEKHVHFAFNPFGIILSITMRSLYCQKNISKGPNKFIKNTEQADDVGISDGSSPKKSIPGQYRALNIDLELSPGPSQNFNPEPWWASIFYYIKVPIFKALLKKLILSLGRSWALLKISIPIPNKMDGSGLGPITNRPHQFKN